MSRFLSHQAQQIKYLLRGTGRRNTARKVIRKLVSPLFEVDTAYISFLHFNQMPMPPDARRELTELGISSCVFTNPEELDALGPCDYDAELRTRIARYIDDNPDRIAIPVLLAQPNSSNRGIIGYLLLDLAHYSYWNGRLKGELPSGCAYIADFFMHPDHRGSWSHRITRLEMHDYFLDRGIRKTVGFVKAHNLPSLNAHRKPYMGVVGSIGETVRRTTFLRGLYERVTPSESVFAMMQQAHVGQTTEKADSVTGIHSPAQIGESS